MCLFHESSLPKPFSSGPSHPSRADREGCRRGLCRVRAARGFLPGRRPSRPTGRDSAPALVRASGGRARARRAPGHDPRARGRRGPGGPGGGHERRSPRSTAGTRSALGGRRRARLSGRRRRPGRARPAHRLGASRTTRGAADGASRSRASRAMRWRSAPAPAGRWSRSSRRSTGRAFAPAGLVSPGAGAAAGADGLGASERRLRGRALRAHARGEWPRATASWTSSTPSESEGIGVRVRHGGGWGFAATRDLGRRDAEAALERRSRSPRRSRVPARRAAGPEPPARGHWRQPVERDPFEVPLEEKLARAAGRRRGPLPATSVIVARRALPWRWRRALFASTEGALCEQHVRDCGGGIAALAVGRDHTAGPLLPASHGGQVAAAARSTSSALDLAGGAPRVAEEAVALLTAPPCPPGRDARDPRRRAARLQIHESVGHAVELDRISAREASYAGTSCVPADGHRRLRYGSEHLNVTADATSPGGLGSSAGTTRACPARRPDRPRRRARRLPVLARDRRRRRPRPLRRLLRAPTGFARQPIVRMTNVTLEPGDAGTLDDLIADTDDGPVSRRTARGRSTTAGCTSSSRARRLRDPRRRARAAVPQPDLRGRSRRASGARCDAVCSAERVAAVWLIELRQGRARAGHAGLARRGAGALPRRAGRRGVSARRASPTSPSARSGHPAATPRRLVTRERSLLLRFARSRPTQATAVDDLTVEILRSSTTATSGARDERPLDDDGLAACAARADAAARPPGPRRAGRLPGLPGAAPAARRLRRPDRRLDPARRRALAAFDGAPSAGPGGVRHLDGGARSRRRSPRAPACGAARPRHRRLHEGHRRRDAGGRSGERARSPSRDLDAARDRRTPRPRLDAAGRAGRAGPGEYPVVLEPDAVGGCSTCSARWLQRPGARRGPRRAERPARQRVAAPAINLSDSPRFAARCRARSTPRAPPRRRCRSSRTASRTGRARHRSAARRRRRAPHRPRLAPGGDPTGPHPTNLVLGGGGAAGRGRAVRPIERGIYVTRLWYVNLVARRRRCSPP